MMQQIQKRLEDFIDLAGRAVSWLTLAMVLITLLVVLLRLFSLGGIALQDLVRYLHAIVFLVGAAYTLKYEEHVRVDIFYSRLGQRARTWIDLFGSLLILIPVMVFIFWISWDYVIASWRVYEVSDESGGLPGLFLIKTFILLMAVLLIIQAVAKILSCIASLKTGEPD